MAQRAGQGFGFTGRYQVAIVTLVENNTSVENGETDEL
jgi:hypothetical protein